MTPVCLCMERSLLNHSRNDYELQLRLAIAPLLSVKNLEITENAKIAHSFRCGDELAAPLGAA